MGFGLLWLMGIHTEISSTLGRMALAGVKLSLVSALTGLVYLLVLRFAAPGESSVMMRPLLTRLRVPGRCGEHPGSVFHAHPPHQLR